MVSQHPTGRTNILYPLVYHCFSRQPTVRSPQAKTGPKPLRSCCSVGRWAGTLRPTRGGSMKSQWAAVRARSRNKQMTSKKKKKHGPKTPSYATCRPLYLARLDWLTTLGMMKARAEINSYGLWDISSISSGRKPVRVGYTPRAWFTAAGRQVGGTIKIFPFKT